jgi:serine/threonine protein kinase
MHVMIDQFVQQIVASGLLTADQIQAVTRDLPADRKPRTSEDLGRELVRQRKLSPYQAKEIYYGRGRSLVMGNYAILDKLGKGGMGLVLKAEHRRMERVVALKILSPKLVRNDDSLRRFQREVKAAARLTHPNIVTAYDADEEAGVHFLVMEYVEGSDLAVLVRQQGPLSVDVALDCIKQAATGLRYAHEHGVIHRDIKPANLLMNLQREVKILDMGLARVSKTDPHDDELTGSGQIIGTVDYMSPEQATSTKDADERADIYSLGITLWYLLTGRPMYAGDAPIQKLLAHQNQEIPSLQEACADVSPALDEVFRRMVAKTPEQRYQTMDEVIQAIESLRAATAANNRSALEDPKLDAFLRGIGPSAASHRSGSSSHAQGSASFHASGAKSRPPADENATVNQGGRQEDTDGRSDRSGSDSHGDLAAVDPWWQDWRLATASATVMVLIAVGLLVVALKLRGEHSRPESPVVQADSAVAAQSPEAESGEPAPAVDTPTEEPQPGDARPEDANGNEAQLILTWRFADWTDSRLEVDGRVYDPAEWADPDVSDTVRLRLPPGERRVWIVRRGFRPFDQTLRLDPGQQIELTPDWQPIAPPDRAQQTDQDRLAEADSDQPGSEMEPSEAEPTAPPKVKPVVAGPTPEQLAALQQLEAAEAAWQEATALAQQRTRAWDFADAVTELETVQFEEASLTQRRDQRKHALTRMVEMKQRIIERINTADPPLTKRALALRGSGGDVIGADERGIQTKLTSGQDELLAWDDLGSQAPGRLLQLAVDQEASEDWLHAALFAMAIGQDDLAERLLARASQMEVEIRPYREMLARTALFEARGLLDANEYEKAVQAMELLESKYAGTSWLAAHQAAAAAVRGAAEQGVWQQQAEELFAQAVDRLEQDQLFELRSLIDRLQTDYAGSPAVTDSDRKPSFAHLEAAVANLGKQWTVRQDGRGDFTEIQAAIDAASPHSLIEIQDAGPYREPIVIEKDGLVLRGRSGVWPIITSAGFPAAVEKLIQVAASDVQLEQLVVIHSNIGGNDPRGIELRWSRGCRVSRLIAFCSGHTIALHGPDHHLAHVDHVFVAGEMHGMLHITNSICLRRTMASFAENSVLGAWDGRGEQCEARRCVILDRVVLRPGSVLVDSIVPSVQASDADVRIEFCNVHGDPPFIDRARDGEGCFPSPPMFAALKNADYRLLPNSPGIGKASDGGDVGARYTPVMVELIKRAFELRARGNIKF